MQLLHELAALEAEGQVSVLIHRVVALKGARLQPSRSLSIWTEEGTKDN